MALRSVSVDVDHFHEDRLLVLAWLGCPLGKITNCEGVVELSFEYLGENTARWKEEDDRYAPCDKCGCMLGLNPSMLSEVLKEATREVKLREYKVPELLNEPELKVEVLTNLPPEYVGRDYLILAIVRCHLPKCKGKTVFSCHLPDSIEGLVFGERGYRQGCEVCGSVSQLTASQISKVVAESRRQLSEAATA